MTAPSSILPPCTVSHSPITPLPASESTSALVEHLVSSKSPLHHSNETLVLPKCNMPPPSEFEKVEVFVANAIKEQHENGNDASPSKPYKLMIDAFRSKQDRSIMRSILLALRTGGNGSTLHLLSSSSSKFSRLIHQVVRLNPFDLPTTGVSTSSMDYDIADAQLHLMITLVSANSVFLVPSLTAIWKLLALVDVPSEDRKFRLHAAMATMVRLCPKAKSELFPIISANCPYRTRPEASLVWYYQQCLAVLEYLPAIKEQVVELLVDKCLELDVEIKISDFGEVSIDEQNDNDEQGVFELDLNDNATKLSRDITVDDVANKLDSLMFLLFEFASWSATLTVSSSEDGIQESSIYGLYDIAARVFESSIIITHKSKFVQFLLLFVCGLESNALGSQTTKSVESSDPLYRDFASRLIDILLDPYRSTVTRQSAACYLASFISRCSFVAAETVCESVAALLRWADAYILAIEDSGESFLRTDDTQGQCNQHSLFYTVCQSAFYIMCFRGVDAIEFFRNETSQSSRQDDLTHINIGSDRWTQLCSHSTKPLRFCLESVRSEFLVLSKAYHLIDIKVLDSLLQDDARMATSTRPRKRKAKAIITAATLEKERLQGGVGGLGRGTNPLDSFFPFDPYLLRRSHAFVDQYYMHWPGGAIGNPEDVGGTDSEDEMDEDINSDNDDASNEADDTDDSSSEDDEEESMRREFQPMSIASQATLASNTSSPLGRVPSTPDSITAHRDNMRNAWTDTLKRTRAPSIENGSW